MATNGWLIMAREEGLYEMPFIGSHAVHGNEPVDLFSLQKKIKKAFCISLQGLQRIGSWSFLEGKPKA